MPDVAGGAELTRTETAGVLFLDPLPDLDLSPSVSEKLLLLVDHSASFSCSLSPPLLSLGGKVAFTLTLLT